MDQERQIIRKQIKEEFRQLIKELEFNILAYQDLLLEKEKEIQASAMNIKELREKGEQHQATFEIQQLKAALQKQIQAVEAMALDSFPVDVNATTKVYKKLEHINSHYDRKLQVIKEEFARKTMEMVGSKDEEIMMLQKKLKDAHDSEVIAVQSTTQRYQLQMERISGECESLKKRFISKSNHVQELLAKIKQMHDERASLIARANAAEEREQQQEAIYEERL